MFVKENTVSAIKEYFFNSLKDLYPKLEVESFFHILCDYFLGYSRVQVAMSLDKTMSESELLKFHYAIKDLKKFKPVQFITGTQFFYDVEFKVTEHTLIPRPETEELISSILENVLKTRSFHTNANEKQLKILDIGTGSGCIPISLKKSLPFAEITAIDVSNEALTIAKKNAVLNKVDINLTQQDILNTTSLNQLYDVIVSNPPYVRESEKKEIKNNVLNNEPHMALFVEDNNPLVFYNKIAELAKNHLTKNGTLFFEINQYLGKETVELIKLKGFNKIQLKKDIFGRDRIIIASL